MENEELNKKEKFKKRFRSRANSRLEELGREPTEMVCKSCGNTVVTKTSRHNGPCVYFGVFALIFLFFPCAWLPLVLPTCKDVLHTCPQCGTELGIYNFA